MPFIFNAITISLQQAPQSSSENLAVTFVFTCELTLFLPKKACEESLLSKVTRSTESTAANFQEAQVGIECSMMNSVKTSSIGRQWGEVNFSCLSCQYRINADLFRVMLCFLKIHRTCVYAAFLV